MVTVFPELDQSRFLTYTRVWRLQPFPPHNQMIEIVLVDDHEMVRSGIRLLLESTGEFRVIGDMGTALDAIAFCEAAQPRVVIMDMSLPVLDGVEALAALIRVSPQTRVLVLTAYDDDRTVVSAIRAGAAGFLLKRGKAADLLSAIRLVASGGIYLSPEVSHCLYDCLRREPELLMGEPAKLLTNRELDVLRMVARGLANKEVAHLLKLSPETIRSYRKSLMKKLGVHNIAGLTQVAIRAGFAPDLEEKEKSTAAGH